MFCRFEKKTILFCFLFSIIVNGFCDFKWNLFRVVVIDEMQWIVLNIHLTVRDFLRNAITQWNLKIVRRYLEQLDWNNFYYKHERDFHLLFSHVTVVGLDKLILSLLSYTQIIVCRSCVEERLQYSCTCTSHIILPLLYSDAMYGQTTTRLVRKVCVIRFLICSLLNTMFLMNGRMDFKVESLSNIVA